MFSILLSAPPSKQTVSETGIAIHPSIKPLLAFGWEERATAIKIEASGLFTSQIGCSLFNWREGRGEEFMHTQGLDKSGYYRQRRCLIVGYSLVLSSCCVYSSLTCHSRMIIDCSCSGLPPPFLLPQPSFSTPLSANLHPLPHLYQWQTNHRLDR